MQGQVIKGEFLEFGDFAPDNAPVKILHEGEYARVEFMVICHFNSIADRQMASEYAGAVFKQIELYDLEKLAVNMTFLNRAQFLAWMAKMMDAKIFFAVEMFGYPVTADTL